MAFFKETLNLPIFLDQFFVLITNMYIVLAKKASRGQVQSNLGKSANYQLSVWRNSNIFGTITTIVLIFYPNPPFSDPLSSFLTLLRT